MRVISDLHQLIYVSQPFGYGDAILSSILLDARRNNLRSDITGALICRHDVYLQLLEGPVEKVEATFERIARDDRHAGVSKLLSQPAAGRLFGDWAMMHDPVRSWIWTEEEIASGVLLQASPLAVLLPFERLSAQARRAG